MGFSDERLAQLSGKTEPRRPCRARACWASSRSTSASTPARPSSPPHTPYMYSTLRGRASARRNAKPIRRDREKVIILGGGPNRIGQGIEFDYCCVHAAYALKEAGIETIMVNCNPETVSHRLRHLRPPLFRAADRRGRDRAGAPRADRTAACWACIVQFGGQTPLKLAAALRRGRDPDPRHHRRRHRPGRGPRALPVAAAAARRCASPTTASRARSRRPRRWPSGSAIPVVIRPVLRAGRARHGDRPRPGGPAPLHARGGPGVAATTRC